MRSYFLIQTIQNWFARVVHQRDRMDAWLDNLCEHRDWRIKGVAHLASISVIGSRKYLGLLMKAGAWISTAFSRQMELDADRQQVAMVGVSVFEETSRQIVLLSAGSQLAWQDVAHDWTLGSLPEDIAQLAVIRTNFLPQEATQQILSAESEQSTGRWDTHPCMSDRILSARVAGFDGAFRSEGSVQNLFTDLPELCRKATLHHYKAILKLDDPVRYVPAHEAIEDAQTQREEEGAVHTLFKTTPLFCSRWFRLPPDEPRRLEDSTKDDQLEPSFDANAYDVAVQTNLLHFAALVIRQSGVAVNPASFRLTAGDFETVRQHESATTRNLSLALDEYRRSAAPIANRVESTIARLLNGEFGIAVSAARSRKIPDIRVAWKSYGALCQFQDTVAEVRRLQVAMGVVRENARHFPAAACANLIVDLQTRASSEIERTVIALAGVPTTVQFDPALSSTIGPQLRGRGVTPDEDIRTFLGRADAMLARTLGQLAWATVSACPSIECEITAETSG
jgi:hypothetical protein